MIIWFLVFVIKKFDLWIVNTGKILLQNCEPKAFGASHVLSTCIDEEYSNLSEALKCVNAKEVIENTIYAYQDWDAQPYCDEILFRFKKHEITKIFEQIKNPSENIKKGVLRFLEL